jgi:hypothetical protein
VPDAPRALCARSSGRGDHRVEPAVQRAFGRTGCAEQSTIARTLQASTAATVDQRSRVSWYSLKRYGQTPHHRFAERLLWVDVDVTPLPIGATAEGSERTWMGCNSSKTGRKTLRVIASDYREMLHETLLRGKASAVPALKAALGDLETRLGWTRERRQRIVLRRRQALAGKLRPSYASLPDLEPAALADAYDGRATIEASFCQDKQALGLMTRRQRRSPLHPLATPLQESFSMLFRGRVRVGCLR